MNVQNMNAVEQVVADQYAIYQGDSCELIRAIPSESIHYGIHSPPFEGLYRFSNSDRDISNNDGGSFWEHYQFLISELFRVTKPGRLCSVHCMQLPTSKTRHGFIGIRDFRGEIVRAYCGDEGAEIYEAMMRVRARADRAAMDGDFPRYDGLIEAATCIEADLASHAGRSGWIFHSEVCIWKDPVVAQQRTKSLRLLHKQIKKDSCMSGQGLADYVMTFRKPGENDEPVSGEFDAFIGAAPNPDDASWSDARTSHGIDVSREAYDRHKQKTIDQGHKPWPFETWVSVMTWQRYASPVWMDIDQSRTLQYRSARAEADEAHISPLQLDVIERCIDLWSNPGDVVLTPFLGIGSEVYCAVEMGRKGIGFELKPSYFAQAVKNIASVKTAAKVETLFDMAAE